MKALHALQSLVLVVAGTAGCFSCAGNPPTPPAEIEDGAPIPARSVERPALKLESMTVDDFALLDQTGKMHELYNQPGARAIVLISYAVACPILRWNLPVVEELVAKYGEQGVHFYYIDASPQDSREDLVTEVEEFGLSVPILQDTAQIVLPTLGVKRTADAFVIDTRTWNLVYRGQINDRATYGAQNTREGGDFLDDALASFLAGDPIEIERTEAKGCLIFYENHGDDAVPNYSSVVAPILAKRCVSCHTPDGIAPWAMSSWQRVRGWSPMIRETVRTKRMPPWHADPHYGEFSNDRALLPSEANTLVRWIDAGAPRGDGPDPLPDLSKLKTPQNSPIHWKLGEPDLIVKASRQELPATGIVPYRYDRAELDIDEDIWVKGVDLKPSNFAVLHHSAILVLYPEHLKDTQPDYAQGVVSYFALYVPGMEVAFFPDGTGKRIPAGSKIVFQFHYTTTGKAEVDEPILGLYLMDEPPEVEYESTSAVKWVIHLPAGKPDHQIRAIRYFARDVMVCDLIPHMHYRGRTMRYDAHKPDGTVQTLLSVPAYDFNWQTAYNLEEPVFLPAGTKIVCTGRMDNSADNPFNPDPTQNVEWGTQSTDEMFIGYMNYYVVPGGTNLLEEQ